MSGASERERVLQLLIPSLVIVVGYVWFFVPEPQGKLDKALGQLEHARSHVTIPLQGQRQSLARVEREVAALRDERDALRRQARDAHAHAAEHTTVESELTRLLRRHGLQLEANSSSPVASVIRLGGRRWQGRGRSGGTPCNVDGLLVKGHESAFVKVLLQHKL